jgi:3-hydroxyisobutyrate dehydrogenase
MALRAGFIGLGNQGRPIAVNLAKSDFKTTVFDVAQSAVVALVAAGAESAATPRQVGEQSDVVGICVPADDHVREVCLGPDGLIAGMSAGGVIAIHSTIQPATAIELAEEASKFDIGLLDACVTGGKVAAEAKRLTLMVGGDKAHFDRAEPVLEISAAKIIHAGALGNGCVLKLCVNLMTYTLWSALHESTVLAKGAGLPIELLEEACLSNGQMTPMMKHFMDVREQPEAVRESAEYKAEFRNHTAIAEKDLDWALRLARSCGVQLPVAGLLAQRMGEIYGVSD